MPCANSILMLDFLETIPEVYPEIYFEKAGLAIFIFGRGLTQAFKRISPITANDKRIVWLLALVFMWFLNLYHKVAGIKNHKGAAFIECSYSSIKCRN